MYKIAVLASGGGTNFQSLIDAVESGFLAGAEITCLVSNRLNAGALNRAEKHGIESRVFSKRDFRSPEEQDAAIVACLETKRPDLIVLAGYLKILTAPFFAAFGDRIINIHPALLPDFGGDGFYGRFVHEAVIKSGAKRSGATVHRVTPEVDRGEIILQQSIEVKPDDTPDTLAARVLTECEHKILPEAVRKIMRDSN